MTPETKDRRQQIGFGFGLASHVERITRAEGSVFVAKSWDCASRTGDREIRVYIEFGPRLGIRTPSFLGAETEAGRHVLRLEWIDGRQGDILEPFPSEALAPFATALARFHAGWLASPALNVPWLPTAPTVRQPGWYEERIARFERRFGHLTSPELRKKIATASEWHRPAVEALRAETPTLLHNDLHADNLLFDANPCPVLLDWANAARGAPAIDIAAIAIATEDEQACVSAYRTASPDLLPENIYTHARENCLLNLTLGMANFDPSSTPRGERLVRRSIDLADRLRTGIPDDSVI